MSRVLPTSEARWLASSGLSHLSRTGDSVEGVHLLATQYRMHSDVSEVISGYQYGGLLQTAEVVKSRSFNPPPLFREQPRATWYVLDADGGELPSIRADRGPGNRSWVRSRTRDILGRVFSDRAVQASNGLFLSPFVAQARDVASFLAERNLTSWTASTVHSQQGAEADIVLFDTVNAGSTCWSIEEWRRLVNVGLSRAREFLVLLASRAEMQSPFLRPLLNHLKPRVLKHIGSAFKWIEVLPPDINDVAEATAKDPNLLGFQIIQRKAMRPVLSFDQQRLCGYRMDGKPRLVRGVAGSGKTAVLAHWLAKTLGTQDADAGGKVWVVYANKALARLLTELAEFAWGEQNPATKFHAKMV